VVGIATKTRARPKKPSMFKVLMLNDDYTPMEFVVMVLKRFFHMDLEQATGSCCTFTRKAWACAACTLRNCRDQGEPGDGFRPAEPAPAAMHAGKGLTPTG
jgi:hypothetical protein